MCSSEGGTLNERDASPYIYSDLRFKRTFILSLDLVLVTTQ